MSLPKPNVKYASSNNQNLDEKELKGMFCNPIYAGIPPYPAIMTDEDWVKVALKEIEEDGAEQFLVNMLYVLRMSMLAANPETQTASTRANKNTSRRRN